MTSNWKRNAIQTEVLLINIEALKLSSQRAQLFLFQINNNNNNLKAKEKGQKKEPRGTQLINHSFQSIQPI